MVSAAAWGRWLRLPFASGATPLGWCGWRPSGSLLCFPTLPTRPGEGKGRSGGGGCKCRWERGLKVEGEACLLLRHGSGKQAAQESWGVRLMIRAAHGL